MAQSCGWFFLADGALDITFMISLHLRIYFVCRGKHAMSHDSTNVDYNSLNRRSVARKSKDIYIHASKNRICALYY